MSLATCAVFFASGAAALIFEALWFRQTGLIFGNTVWASALVTASFMAGLALGNTFAIRRGWSLARPLRVFAALELAVGATGSALVMAMPVLSRAAAPLLGRLPAGSALDAVRLASAFVLLVVPASAMGATLPVLARSLGARDPNFGRVLGRLYGWNTMGAVAGVLAAEGVLVPALGVRWSAAAAALLDVSAAVGALLLDRRQPALAISGERPSAALPPPAARVAATAFVAGGLLLALEVVWFRFLLMFMWATSITFAILLAVVLLGIAGGGLIASAWLGRRPAASRHAPVVAFLTGAALVASYAGMEGGLPSRGSAPFSAWLQTGHAALWLMLPVCLGSGLLFTLLGKALHAEAAEEARAAGLLTLSNTVGAMLGSLAAAFLLLPVLGIERSFFLLAAGYGVVAALAWGKDTSRRAAGVAGGLYGLALAFFPFGAMSARYVSRLEEAWGGRVVAVREGLTETVFLLRNDWLGEPARWRLLTNAMAMSDTSFIARRYMGFFVWWPAAVHPRPRTALVISYGVGNTARTLTAIGSIERIDVVDVSVDVLRMSAQVWRGPGEDPLRDPRVHVNVEDGRFHLLTSQRLYDLVTGEPPPPKSAGIVNLYSREYFALMRQRLAPGGVATYWLPVLNLAPRETFSVVRGFCDVFEDCSLWSSWGHEWMLVGTAGLRGAAAGDDFARLWSDAAIARSLEAAGFDSPASLGATFLADAAQLRPLTADVQPLVDDAPYRIDARWPLARAWGEYAALMEPEAARRRFEASALVRRLWPAALVRPTLAEFERQALVNRLSLHYEGVVPGRIDLATQEAAITRTGGAVALWSLGSSVETLDIARRLAQRGVRRPEVSEQLGLGHLARREYREAEALLERAEPYAPHAAALRRLRILSLALAGDSQGAGRLFGEASPALLAAEPDQWAWLAARFRLSREVSSAPAGGGR